MYVFPKGNSNQQQQKILGAALLQMMNIVKTPDAQDLLFADISASSGPVSHSFLCSYKSSMRLDGQLRTVCTDSSTGSLTRGGSSSCIIISALPTPHTVPAYIYYHMGVITT